MITSTRMEQDKITTTATQNKSFQSVGANAKIKSDQMMEITEDVGFHPQLKASAMKATRNTKQAA